LFTPDASEGFNVETEGFGAEFAINALRFDERYIFVLGHHFAQAKPSTTLDAARASKHLVNG
jgi:hypothetical protein